MILGVEEFVRSTGIRGLKPGVFGRWGGSEGEAWIHWDSEGNVTIDIYDPPSGGLSDDGEPVVAIRGIHDAQAGTVDLAGSDDDLLARMDDVRMRVSRMTPMVGR